MHSSRMRTACSSSRLLGGGGCLLQCMLGYTYPHPPGPGHPSPQYGPGHLPPGVGLETPQAWAWRPPGCGPGDPLIATVLLLSTRLQGRDQLLRMSRTLHRPAPDPLLRPIGGHYGQEGWYPRRDPTARLAALDAGRIPDRKSTSRCVMMTLHLGRDDRGKENAVSPP